VTPNSGATGTQGGEEDDSLGSTGNPATMAALMPMILQQMVQGGASKSKVDPVQAMLLMLMHQMINKGADDVPAIRGTAPGINRTVKPTVKRGEDSRVIPQMKADRLPKIRLGGLNLVIENPRGTFREGVNLDGSEWSVEMPHHYGYIKGYEGADGDEVDCFVGPNMRSRDVYVITQNNEQGEFDEYKCMLGFDDEQEAIAGYNDSFTDGWDGFGACQRMSLDDFKNWLDAGMGAGCTALVSSPAPVEG
jgi:hypothetical protein